MNPTGNSGAGQSGIDKFSRFGKYTKGFKSIGVIDREETQITPIDIPAPPKRKKKKKKTIKNRRKKKGLDGPVFRKKIRRAKRTLAFRKDLTYQNLDIG